MTGVDKTLCQNQLLKLRGWACTVLNRNLVFISIQRSDPAYSILAAVVVTNRPKEKAATVAAY